MTRPTFSIVIPTVNRHELLEKTIAACLLSPYPNLEVLVSDNFSTPETAAVVETFRKDTRVRYVQTDRRLSMPDHWEFAWQQAKGDFIIINGDDDAMSPSLVDRLVEIARDLSAGLISWDAGLYYHLDWNLDGRNTFTFMSGHSGMLLDIDPQAIFASYARLEIPICFPQGTRICFARDLARRAVAATGRLIWAPYPDYSAPLLLLGLLQGERYIYMDVLAGYGGRSRQSNAAAWEKQRGKTGNPQRAKEYFEEFVEEDLYPHSALKIRAYSNGHAETLNLLRHILPAAFSRYHVDTAALIGAVECEFRGVGIHNPFLGSRERRVFETFLAAQDSEAVSAGMRRAEVRGLFEGPERWRRKPTTPLEDVMRLIAQMRMAMKVVGRGRFSTSAFAHLVTRRKRTVADGSSSRSVRLQYKGRMVRLACEDIGSHDALDLAYQLDDIVERFDSRGWSNVSAFAAAGLLRAAYTSVASARPPTSGTWAGA